MAAPLLDRCGAFLRVRPLVPVAVAFMGGIGLGETAAGRVGLTGLAAAALMAAWRGKRRAARPIALLAIFAAAGAWRCALTASPGPYDVSRYADARFATVSGTLVGDVDADRRAVTCEIAVRRIVMYNGNSRACAGRVAAWLPRRKGQPVPDYGDTVEAHGRLEPPTGARNPGGFDSGSNLRRRGIFATLTARRPESWQFASDPATPHTLLSRLAARARASLLAALSRVLPPAEAGLLAGILLGTRSTLPSPVSDDFAVTGTAHILAVSGMNVAMLAAMLGGLLRRSGMNRPAALAISLCGLAFYTLMAGARPSVLRADLMASLFMIGWLLGRRADGLNTLAAAVLVTLLLEPGELFSAGFQLSFVITAWLLAAAPLLQRLSAGLWGEPAIPAHRLPLRLRLLRSLALALLVSLLAQFAAAPLLAQHFQQVSLVGLMANAFIVPPLALLLAGGLAAWLFALLWPPLAVLMAACLLSPLLAYLLGVARVFAGLPYAALPVPAPGWLLIVLCYAAFGLLLAAIQKTTTEAERHRERERVEA